MHRFIILTFLLVASMLVSACIGQSTPVPTSGSDPTTAPTQAATAVASTTEESAQEGSFALDPSQISLDGQGLGVSWQAVVVPGEAYDASQPPGPMGLPTHTEILFDGSDAAESVPGDPIMYIIPVNEYRMLWDDAGNPAVSQTIAQIERFAAALNPSIESGLPALPFEQVAGANDLAVQIGRATPAGQVNTTSATQDGYRFVGRWAQDANPATNQNLRYVYQGFTNDGVYLVSFWWPISTSQLPNEAGEVPPGQMEQFNADMPAYMTATAKTLNGLSSDQWTPDLASLDALVASLEIQGMTSSGLLDTTWEWVSGPAQPGSSEMITVTEPSRYQATYGSDGALTFVADCNRGSMGFELRDTGNNGGMLADFNAVLTMAECGEGSLSQSFVGGLQAAQNYRVQGGGNQMQLILPAGGGEWVMHNTAATATR